MKREELNYVGAINMSKGLKIDDYYLQSIGTNEKSSHESVIVNLCKEKELASIDLTTIYRIDNFISIVKKHNDHIYTNEQLDKFNNDLYDMVDTFKKEEDMKKGAYMIIKNIYTYDYVEELRKDTEPNLLSILKEIASNIPYVTTEENIPHVTTEENIEDFEEARLKRIINRRLGLEGMEVVKERINTDLIDLQKHYVEEDDTDHVTKLQEIIFCQIALIKDLRIRVKNLEEKEGK